MRRANRHPQARAQQKDHVHYPLPRDTQQAFERLSAQQPTNLGLIFDRFALDWSRDATLKKQALETVRHRAGAFAAEYLKELLRRWRLCVEAAHGVPFALSTEWRFVAGLGRKGSLEVGFTFNRHGVPILPGSSVKGIARAAARYEGISEDDSDFVEIFGHVSEKDEEGGRAGGAIFFDAVPHWIKLDLDVMNPHFPNYYQKGDPPAVWQSPVPVYFLTVAPGVPFWFAVGWRGVFDQNAQRLRQRAEDWLRLGLTTLGAGAKTNAGYGFFVPAPPEIKLL